MEKNKSTKNKGIKEKSIKKNEMKFSSTYCDLLGTTPEELQKEIDKDKFTKKKILNKTLCCNIL